MGLEWEGFSSKTVFFERCVSVVITSHNKLYLWGSMALSYRGWVRQGEAVVHVFIHVTHIIKRTFTLAHSTAVR